MQVSQNLRLIFIFKFQVKEYVHNKFGIVATDAEIDEFFKVGKTDSKDTDLNRLTAIEYTMNIHSYPVIPKLSCALATKIANIKPETVKEIKDWLNRINNVVDALKRGNVNDIFYLFRLME